MHHSNHYTIQPFFPYSNNRCTTSYITKYFPIFYFIRSIQFISQFTSNTNNKVEKKLIYVCSLIPNWSYKFNVKSMRTHNMKLPSVTFILGPTSTEESMEQLVPRCWMTGTSMESYRLQSKGNIRIYLHLHRFSKHKK